MFPQPPSNRSTFPPSSTAQLRGASNQRSPEAHLGPDDDAGWQGAPNPFARMLAAREPSPTTRFVRAAKTLVIALAMTSLLFAGMFFGKQFLLSRLIAGFDELDATAQQNCLTQIASFGSDAIEPLVEKLAAADDAVSESAFTLLQQMQNDWTMLPPDAAKTAHERMIGAIAATFEARNSQSPRQLSPGRVARAGELLRQSILEFASTPAHSSNLLVAANRVMTGLEGRPAALPTLADAPIKLGASPKLHAVAKFVQPSSTIQQSGWTDWPPPANTPPAQIIRPETRHVSCESEVMSASARPAHSSLQALPHGVTAPLRPVTPHPVTPHPVTQHDPVLAVPPVEVALADRGFSEHQVEAASSFLSATPEERMRLTDCLARSGDLASDPWFSLVLNDPDRRVRLQAASALEATQDPAVRANLREHLARESDPHVAARIRRILQLF